MAQVKRLPVRLLASCPLRRKNLRSGGWRDKREDQLLGGGTEADESMMAVKGFGPVVLGVDHKGENNHFGAQGACHGIPHKSAAQSAAPIALVDGKAAQPGDGYGRVAGKALDDSLRHVRQGNAAGGKRVVAGHFGGCGLKRDVAGRGPTPHVLGHLRQKVSV